VSLWHVGLGEQARGDEILDCRADRFEQRDLVVVSKSTDLGGLTPAIDRVA